MILFTYQLSSKEAVAAVGDLGLPGRSARRHWRGHAFPRASMVVAMLSRDLDDLSGSVQLLLKPVSGAASSQPCPRYGRFRFSATTVRARTKRTPKDHLVANPLSAIHDKDHHVDRLQRCRGGFVHVTVQRLFTALVHARGINIDRLHVAFGLDAQHVVASGLRLARGDRQRF